MCRLEKCSKSSELRTFLATGVKYKLVRNHLKPYVNVLEPSKLYKQKNRFKELKKMKWSSWVYSLDHFVFKTSEFHCFSSWKEKMKNKISKLISKFLKERKHWFLINTDGSNFLTWLCQLIDFKFSFRSIGIDISFHKIMNGILNPCFRSCLKPFPEDL